MLGVKIVLVVAILLMFMVVFVAADVVSSLSIIDVCIGLASNCSATVCVGAVFLVNATLFVVDAIATAFVVGGLVGLCFSVCALSRGVHVILAEFPLFPA